MSLPRTNKVSRLLIAEPPLQVLPSLATAIGLNEAIFLQQIYYWSLGASGVEADGHRWIYNTQEQWRAQFPFWSVDTIQRTVKSLRTKGVLLTTNKMNRSKMDRTLWYAIDHEKLDDLIDDSAESRNDNRKLRLSSPQDAAMEDRNLPDSNQETTQETTTRDEMWQQLALLGIPDRRSYIRLIGRAPYDDPAATLEFARRQLAEKKRRA